MTSTTKTTSTASLQSIVAMVMRGEILSADDAEAAILHIMEGRGTPMLSAALLAGLRARGEAKEEIAGGVRALRHAMIPVRIDGAHTLVDTCGTGGGTLSTFNISTAAALVAAGAGVRIAKHGNRSFSSRSGSADILGALGVQFDLTPKGMQDVFEDAGIVFMFAPLLHPAMRHIAPVRKELAVPTIMNILGPLANPASARLQVIGVSDPALLDMVAGALHELGHERALVVHGAPGMDELSPIGATDIIELKDRALARTIFDPREELGWEQFDAADLAGGEPDENARIVTDVLTGERRGAARAAVVLNAAAAIYVAGLADSIIDGVLVAEESLDAGKGMAALDRLRAASARAERVSAQGGGSSNTAL